MRFFSNHKTVKQQVLQPLFQNQHRFVLLSPHFQRMFQYSGEDQKMANEDSINFHLNSFVENLKDT